MRDKGWAMKTSSSLILRPSSFILSLLLLPSSAAADGGALRLAEQKDGYRIAVFTAPTPLRAGPADISVLVQDAATGDPASAVQVSIAARRHDVYSDEICHPATTQAATNKLYHAATFELPDPGWYSVKVRVVGDRGATQLDFDVEAGDAFPAALSELPWLGWPLLAILLFVIHQFLVRSRDRK